jgi:hypothetical protein
LGIYVQGAIRIDRRGGQFLAQYPVLQDMHYHEGIHGLVGLSKLRIAPERNYYLKDLNEEDIEFCPDK